MLENPLKIFKYLEKINDTIFSNKDENIAPFIWFFNFNLCLDINLYISKNTIKAPIINKHWYVISDKIV